MGKEKLPINYEILQWSRKSIGLSIEDVANKLKKNPSVIQAWESGEESPTYPQLEKLAYNLYKRPIALFFFPSVPDEDTPITDFRTLPEALTQDLPTEIIKIYRKAKFFQISLEELYYGERPSKKSLLRSFSLKNINNFKEVTIKIRNFLDINIQDQFLWESDDIALKYWRNKLEDCGIFIFKDAFKNNDYSGFCVYHDKYPIIYLNNSMPFSRQLFTLAHELGHLLIHLGGIDFRENSFIFSYNQEFINYEQICNLFANEFLVPSVFFNNEDLSISEKNINDLSNKYSVSREVILRKFYDLNLINNDYYNQLVSKWKNNISKSNKRGSGGDYYRTQKSYLGDSYINLVFSRYYQNKISLESLSTYLNIKMKNVANFEHYVFC